MTPWIVGAPLSMHSPGKNTGVDCHARLQGIFLTQGSNLCLLGFLHRWAGSLPLVPAEGEGARADLRGRNSKQRVEADRQRGELTCTTRALKSQGRKHGFPKAERRADIISVLHVCLGFVNLARFLLPASSLCVPGCHRNRLSGVPCSSGF